MKLPPHSLALLVVLAATTAASAQERIPEKEAQRAAHKLVSALGQPTDAPYTADVDPDQANGFKGGSVGLMALPDRKLTVHGMEHAAKELLPVGQLWMLSASLADRGQAIARDQVRTVKITDGDSTKEVELYYLGAAKNDAGELELVIFAKDKEQPFLRAPLKKTGSGTSSALIELEGRKQDETTGVLTIRLLGEYSTEVKVMLPK